jgi:membrane fusion protein (multidrug efflux system)
MKRFLVPALLGLILVAGLAGAAWWFLEARHVQTTDNAYVEADMAVIAPRVAGYVAEVDVADNQPVEAGDILVRLVDAEYRAAFARADADVERLRRLTGAARASAEAAGSAIAQRAADLAAARAEVSRAEADMARADELLKRGFATRALSDTRKAALLTAQARVREGEAALAAARSGRTAATGTASGEAAALTAAIATREAAALDLANTVIRAPFAGIIGNRSARVGQYARVGQQLMVVVPVEEAYLVANFKETQVGRMLVGMPVRVTLDAFPDAPMEGRITSFSPASGSRFSVIPPENATGNFTRVVQRLPVRIEIDRPLPRGVRLVPGLSARVRVDLRDRPA